MNVIDFCIVFTLLIFLTERNSRSFTFCLAFSVCVFTGYSLGVLLAPSVTRNISSYTGKSVATLVLVFGLTILLGVVGAIIGRRLKVKVLLSRFYKLDRWASWPYKLLSVLLMTVIVSHTLIYVPLLSLQYIAQGSLLLMVADRVTPPSVLEAAAQKIAPDQFSTLLLEYDPAPHASNIRGVGDFQEAINAAADSIVKVSGKGCTGLGTGSGFVVAPNLILTNTHVVAGRNSIYIRDAHGTYPATPVITDRDYDIAILYSKFLKAKPLEFASTPAQLHDRALSVGYPAGGNGNLRAVESEVYDKPLASQHNKLDGTTTLTLKNALGPGSSGGPVLNTAGKVIGVNAAGGSGDLIAIQADIASRIVQKAKGKLTPTSTDLCEIPPKYY